MRRLLLAAIAFAACSSPDGVAPAPDASSDAASTDADAADSSSPGADWIVAIDGTTSPRKLSRALLGHYDLSGALFAYDQVQPSLAAAMAPAGFHAWRIGLGRWEASTQLLPALTDGTTCDLSLFPTQALAPAGTTDLQLIAARDWFVDDGNAVTIADTQNDARYMLSAVRRGIDVATALGAEAYVDVDHMPRAFAANRTPTRTKAAWPDACNWTWVNAVSDVAPADAYLASPYAFAAAVRGMVQRVVEGSGGEPGRAAAYWEFWNEPELPYAWQPKYDDAKFTKFFTSAIQSLVVIDQYRQSASNANAKKIEIGLASFAMAQTAASVIAALDQTAQPVPVDFFSFHSYSNDPLVIVGDVAKVVAARAASKRYANAELSLSEWGPDLQNTLDPATMDPALLVATVLARGASLGLDRSYHTFFWDFYSLVPWGLLDHAVVPKPLFRAYELLAAVVAGGSDRLVVGGAADGSLGGGDGAVLASKDAGGKTRVLLVNRAASPHVARVDVGGAAATPSRVRVFDAPGAAPHDAQPTAAFALPARSITLVEM